MNNEPYRRWRLGILGLWIASGVVVIVTPVLLVVRMIVA